MNTEINILKDGKWVALDMYADAGAVAMNYSANDLGEFEERAGDYSQEVSLPRSAKNMAILGIPLLPYGTGDTPYKAYECEVLEGGVPIVEIGAKLEIISLEDDSISVQVVGNAIDLADTLENTEMADPNGGFAVKWSAESMGRDMYILESGVYLRWCFMTMGTDPLDLSNPAMIPSEFINTAARAYPFLCFYQLVEWILKDAGWTLNAEGADVLYSGVGMLFESMQVGAVCPKLEAVLSLDRATARAYGTKEYNLLYQNASAESPTGYFLNVGQYQYNENTQNPQGFMTATPNVIRFLALTSGSMIVGVDGMLQITYDDNGTAQTSGTITVSHNGNTVETFDIPVGSQFKDAVTIECEAGDIVEMSESVTLTSRATGDHGDIVARATFTFDYQTWMTLNASELIEDNTEPYVGATYDLLGCLGFDNRLEPVQEFMRLCGLSLRLNNETKTAYMYTMKEVYNKANETEAYDWSKKLIKGSRSFTFAPDDYAKANSMKFAENDAEGWQDEYILNIENDSLEKEKDIFESKFLSVRQYTANTINVPIYDYSEDGGLSYSTPDKPLLVMIGTIYDRFSIEEEDVSYDIPLWRVSQIKMQWFADNMYGVWFGMLKEWRGAECVFALTPIDLNKIDLSKPVYIEEFGHYYYIRSIDNFTAGQLTTVQLAKIK